MPADCIIEWCDNQDNDCDGLIDEHHACPDSSIRHTLPFEAIVYVPVWSDDSTQLVPIWPSGHEPVDLPAGTTRVRATRHGTLFMSGGRRYLSAPDGSLVELLTPPCFARPNIGGFDSAGRLYYSCDGEDGLRDVRRGSGVGELLGRVPSAWHLRGVLDSGRLLANNNWEFRLWDRDASTISEAPNEDFLGPTHTMKSAVYTIGEDAFVAYDRTYRDGTRREVVILRVCGATGAWSVVRRVPWPGGYRSGISMLALPDGRLFVRRVSGARSDNAVIVEYPPEGPSRVVWRDSERLSSSEQRSGLFAAPSL